MAGAEYFIKMNLQQGYHQIRVKPEHVPQTAFETTFGSFEFRAMPLVLCNAPRTFQRTMNNLLPCFRGCVHRRHCHHSAYPGHLTHLRAVLHRLRAEKLFAKLKKCSFGQRKIEFCGYLVNCDGTQSLPDKFTAIATWPMPRTVKDVRSFLGLAGFYQRFANNFADTAAP